VNFLRRLALQEKNKLDDSSRLDNVEIARVPDMLPSCFLPGWAKDLSAYSFYVNQQWTKYIFYFNNIYIKNQPLYVCMYCVFLKVALYASHITLDWFGQQSRTQCTAAICRDLYVSI